MSCSDWLSLEPVDKLNSDSFYKTPEQALQALTATYNVLGWDGSTNIHFVSEIASDNCFTGGGMADNAPDVDVFKKTVDECKDEWVKGYTGIFRANSLISRIDNVEWGNQTTLKATYEAEAKFLRAYFYFDLVRMFGNIPLLEKPLTATDSYQIPQATPESVYKLIAEDLKFAVENLPSQAYSAYDKGHATRWSAEALLARVYLYYTGYYKKSDLAGVVTKDYVLTGLEDLITNSGHDLLPTYSALWQADATHYAKDNKEYVFSIKHTSAGKGDWNLKYGNRFQVLVSLRNQKLGDYLNGWGLGTVNAKLWNAYDAADTRRGATIISVADEKLAYDASDQRHHTGYFWKKYTRVKAFDCTTVGGDFQIDNDADVAVIRYSDVLLMAAELGSAHAQTYLDRVRDRAFGDNTHRVTVNAAAIQNERYLEFALEGLRYWDLLRQGMDVTKAAIDNAGNGVLPTISFRTETNGLFPIPESQISLSGGTIVQNPGW